jgi:hypothetical protein
MDTDGATGKRDEKGHYLSEKDQGAVANSPETASAVTSA